MQNLVVSFISKLYDRNPVSYKIMREFYHCWQGKITERADNYPPRISKTLKCILILPLIPFWNQIAKKEIKEIKNNGNIFCIKNGKVKFYLPDLNISRGEFIQNRIFLERDYFEIFHLSQLKKYVKKNAVILDIGANIGNHTIFFAKECCASKIYSFEPTQKTFQILEENIKINQLEHTVTAMNVALGSKNSKADVIVDKSDAGSNHVEENAAGNIVMTSLDSLDFDERIDFIKIDVEGYEYEVLKGAEKTLIKNKPSLFVEIFDTNYDKVHSLLMKTGYECKLKMEQDYLYTCRKKLPKGEK